MKYQFLRHKQTGDIFCLRTDDAGLTPEGHGPLRASHLGCFKGKALKALAEHLPYTKSIGQLIAGQKDFFESA